MTASESAEAAFACALRILTLRDHTEQELLRKLRQKGYPAEILSGVVERLKQLKYLDDRRFAARWVDGAVAGRRFFGPRLRAELLRRGVSREVAAEVVDEALSECDESSLISELLSRKFPGFVAHDASVAEQRRVFNYLQRHGYSVSAIVQALRLSAGSLPVQ